MSLPRPTFGWLCVGGPLDGQRKEARGVRLIVPLRHKHGIENFEYEGMAITTELGRYVFWVPKDRTIDQVLHHLVSFYAENVRRV